MAQTFAAYPAVLPPGINLHVAAVVGILQQTVVLEEQPGALAQTLALVLVILLDELLHQLEQTLRVPGIPLDQVLRWKSERRGEHLRAKCVSVKWICSLVLCQNPPSSSLKVTSNTPV